MALAWVLVIAFLLLVIFRVPVGFALLIPSILYILWFDVTFFVVAQRMSRTLFSFTLLSVPLFIFAGTLMNESGQTEHIFKFANSMVGHIQGGLAYVNILVSLIFSGMSGSALADVGGVGQVLIQAMEEHGYRNDFSAAITSASSTVGPIFPPSIPLIIFGLLAQVSVLDLLLAGILPGLLATGLLSAATFLVARDIEHVKTEKQGLRERLFSLKAALPALLAPVILVGGMLTGFFGPSEIAGVTVLYIIVANFVFYHDYEASFIWRASKKATDLTIKVLFILMAAKVFAFVLTLERITASVIPVLEIFGGNVIAVLLFVNLCLLLLGLFMEPLSAMVMSIPIFVPPLVSFGLDPVHIGVMMVLNLMIGLLTPPVGLTLFVASDISGASINSIVSKLGIYYVALIVALLLIIFFPDISLTIPSL